MNTMVRVWITGSSDGIGQAGAKMLADQGHSVWLHARSDERAKQAQAAVPKAAGVLVGDLSSIAGSKKLAEDANRTCGAFDVVVHNAGLGPSNSDTKTADGLSSTFAVNSLAPYILTALMDKPKKLLYLSSGMHSSGDASLNDVGWRERKRWNASQAYCDSKLHDVLLAKAVAGRWPDVQSNALDPGWIKTKMGGGGAPGVVGTPAQAIAGYVVGGGGDVTGGKTGLYCDPSGVKTPHKGTMDESKQDEFMKICEELSGVRWPSK